MPLLQSCSEVAADTKTSRDCMTECTPRVGVMAAFGQEADLLHERMQKPREYHINGNRFTTGTLEGTPVVLVMSGIGLPNSVMITQLMINHFVVDSIVFSGIAGGINPEHKVGDVVVPRQWAFHQEVYLANTAQVPQPCGTPGELACLGLQMAPGLAPYGEGYFQRTTNVVNAATGGQPALHDPFTGAPVAYGEMRFDYPADAGMYRVAQASLAQVAGTLESVCVTGSPCTPPRVVMSERCVSGPMFVASSAYREYLARELKADCADMETTGVAHVARANGLPFIGFRSLSDLAGDDGHPQAVGEFFGSGIAQRNAARVTLGFLKGWREQRARP